MADDKAIKGLGGKSEESSWLPNFSVGMDKDASFYEGVVKPTVKQIPTALMALGGRAGPAAAGPKIRQQPGAAQKPARSQFDKTSKADQEIANHIYEGIESGKYHPPDHVGTTGFDDWFMELHEQLKLDRLFPGGRQ